jgi:hypothetical protein
MRINVRRMGVDDSFICSFPGVRADDFRRAEQLGTDRQARGTGGYHMDAQPKTIIFGYEL